MNTCQPLNPKSCWNELLRATMLWDPVDYPYHRSLRVRTTRISSTWLSHGYGLFTTCHLMLIFPCSLACIPCFYAFAMQLWPLFASTHDSPLWYSYVYLHAWWRSLLLLPCLSCAPCYWCLLCWESNDAPLLFTYGLSPIHSCHSTHILLACLWYVMCIIHAHYLNTWHACHDSF